MKKRFLSWVKERLFLIVIVFLYSVVAFINLGDFDAPQTFKMLKSREKIAIVLPEAKKVSDVMICSGALNDIKGSYQIVKSEICNCDNNSPLQINPDNLAEEEEFEIDSSFHWARLKVNQIVSVIFISGNKGRATPFGEVGVLDENSEIINGIKVYKASYHTVNSSEEISELMDEQNVIPKEITAMNSMIFDELYFGQTAYQYAHGTEGYETVHPPLGKILQSIPIFISGKMSPFTWRFMGTFTGIIIIIAVYYLALELFKKKKYANIATTLISLSCLHFIQTRVGTVDSYLCLFTTLSYLFMFKLVNEPKKKKYFALSGLFFGCAISVKWSGAFGGIGLAIIFFNYLIKNKFFKKKKIKKLWPWIFRGLIFFVLVPLLIYCTSYLAFSKTTKAESIRDIYDQGVNLFTYHANESTPHESSSPWFTWPIVLVGFPFYESEDGTKTIGLFGNNVLAYTSVIALLVTAYYAFKKHDKLSIRLLVPYLSLLLPYAFITRPMFLYHYLPASIFAILAIVNLIQKFPEAETFLTRVIIGSSLILFILLYPQMTGVI